MPSASHPRRLAFAIAALALVAFLAWALPGAGSRGILGEEVQPFLTRHAIVLEATGGGPRPMPPYEGAARFGEDAERSAAGARPRWVASSAWPVVAYDGEARTWPVFIRGHQTSLGSLPGILWGKWLGGGIVGPRRLTSLLGALIVALAAWAAFRLNERRGDRRALWAAAVTGSLLACSWGMISIARTAESFEVASRTWMMAALVPLLGPVTARRAAIAGLLGAIAILCRGTIGVALLPAMGVLCLAAGSRRKTPLLALGLSAALPVIVVAVLARIAPFRPGTEPLADLPLSAIGGRILGLPRQATLTLAWLGDATSVWLPLSVGHLSLGPTLPVPALVAAIPTGVAIARIARKKAGIGEQLYLATLGTGILAGSVLYSGPDQFQLALAIEPFLAMAIAEQVLSIRGRALGGAAGIAALLVRIQGAAWGIRLDGENANPMLSGAAQRACVDRLRGLGARGPEVLTTVYNQAGVIEGWTGGIDADPARGESGVIRAVHAWPLLAARRSDPQACGLDRAWVQILTQVRPRWVVLTEGPNLYESGGMVPTWIGDTLFRAAARGGIGIRDEGHFPTESGGPGWALVEILYPERWRDGFAEIAQLEGCAAEERGRGPERKALSEHLGLRVGQRLGPAPGRMITRIEAAEGEVRVVLSLEGQDMVLYVAESREGGPAAPAEKGRFGVYYQSDGARIWGAEEMVSWCRVVAEALSVDGAASPGERP